MVKPTVKVLIVDDDPAIRDSVRLALEEQDVVNVKITECSDVDSGIQHMSYINPDVVILDLHMPGKNGWDFIDTARHNIRASKTSVIILTGDDSLDNIFKGEDKGVEVCHFLGKPFNITELQSLVIARGILNKN